MVSRSRILIADDHLLVAEVCQKLLEREFDVVGVVADGRELVNAATELLPDLVILEIGMPHLNGLDACEQVKKKHRATKLVFLTITDKPEVAAEAFRRGASGYVPKHCSGHELIVAVRRVLRGETYLSPLISKYPLAHLLATNPENSKSRNISIRQREVLQLLAEGKSLKEVAYTLNVKPGTVAFHKYKMMENLNIRSNAALIEYAVRQHIIARK